MKMTSSRAILAAAAVILLAGGVYWQFFRVRKPSATPPNYDVHSAIIEREKAAGREVRTIDIPINIKEDEPTEIKTLSINARGGEKVKFRFRAAVGPGGAAFTLKATRPNSDGVPVTHASSSGTSFRDGTSGESIHETVLIFHDDMSGTFDMQFRMVGYPVITFKDALKMTLADKSNEDPAANPAGK